ncbi:MAG: alpha/beta hydrolase [Myxococcaceae bacterium]|nr:alpha/beta hydrolase [Myxococcaceae bacterium]
MNTAIRDGLRKTLSEQVAPAFSSGVPLERQRQALESLGASAALPEGLQIERRELAGLRTEWLVGPGCNTSHALLHLHGGGYVMGSCVTHRALSGRAGIACGMQAVLPEYRLAPEHPFPAALDDAVAAYRGLLALGFAPDKIVLLGDSAGGGLTLATLLALRDAGAPLPAAAVLLSPWTDMTVSGESVRTRAGVDPWLKPELLEPFGKLYTGEHDREGPLVSPLFGDHRGLPPMLVQVGDQEILLSDSTRLAERAKGAGVEVELEIWPELWHVWHLFAPVLPDANAAFDRIGAFVRGKLSAR